MSAPRERASVLVPPPEGPAALAAWDAIIDARSPAEFAEDRLPGAINCPSLDDGERIVVGTAYKQRGAFEAKRIGAPLVARNVARHLEERFAAMPRGWRPLVYCWRGGTRSGALVHVLRQVGWDARQLDGGYKAFRRRVVADLETAPARLAFRVVCGATGSGKSRLLAALAAAGAQVLDLEALAAHRGSLLGEVPGEPQPSQKAFETALWQALGGFDPSRPVFVEAESRKVGECRVPDALIARMREGDCLRLEVPRPARVALLVEDYAHFVADPAALGEKLDCLVPLHGRERIEGWKALAFARDWPALVGGLLDEHYDPAYRRSSSRNYAGFDAARPIAVESAAPQAFADLAAGLAAEAAGGRIG